MKKQLFSLLFVTIFLSSCSQVYHYVQVFETKSLSNSIQKQGDGLVYEDTTCAIYYRFWADGGDAGFSIYNKTNQIIYVDLSKSFFVRNGTAYDYYKDRSWSQTETSTFGAQTANAAAVSGSASRSIGISAAYAGNFGTLPFTPYDPILTSANLYKAESYGALRYSALASTYASASSLSIAVKEPKILAIPPHAAKIVAEYSINDKIFLYCDLDRYPEEQASLSFSEENSPLIFSNYITYRLGESTQDVIIENAFYISKITNYTRPSIYNYVEKQKPCQNLTDDDSKNYRETYLVKVYRRVLNVDPSNNFFVEYKIRSNRKLYKDDDTNYYYNEFYEGWTTGGGDDQSTYQQRLLNPFQKN